VVVNYLTQARKRTVVESINKTGTRAAAFGVEVSLGGALCGP